MTDSLGEGGSERNLLTLVRTLRDCEHHLAWLYDDARLLKEVAPHVQTRSYLEARRGLGLVAAALRLRRVIRDVDPDLVHAGAIRAQLVARVAAFLCRRPVITTWQCVSYNARMYIELGWKRPFLKAVTRLLDAVTGVLDRHFIAVSQEVARYNAARLLVSPARVTVVYNAVEPRKFAEPAQELVERFRQEIRAVPGPLLLSVGRLVDQKNHFATVSAFPIIRRSFPNAVLAIAGAGHLESAIRAHASNLGVSSAVHLLGQRSDVSVLLAAADVFVLASFYEGFGISLAEALAAGVPAVLSDIPTSREVAEGVPSVLFFRPDDPNGLASAAIELLSRKDEVRVQARESASALQARFSPEIMAAGFLEVAKRAVSP